MTDPMRAPRFLPFAFAIALLSALVVVPDSVHAQPVPVTDIENAAGDSVLTVFEDGGFAAYGEEGTGTIPIEGEGTRLMWYPAKAAFRAGEVGFSIDTDGNWDEGNVGDGSAAFGTDTEASGNNSTAVGDETTASGENSTAMGLGTTASGRNSTATGVFTDAVGDQSTAMGSNAQALGSVSTAMGFLTEASGFAAAATGYNTVAATDESLSIGRYNDANRGNDDSDPETGPLFVVGNGRSGFRSDALVLDQSGDLEISGTLTENSDRRLKTQVQPLGTDVLPPLGEIEPVRFQFEDERTHPSGPQLGLIAQEVQAQFPALVSEGASGYLSVSYSKFTAVLLKGLQEQQAEIERLEARQAEVASLRKENEAIKKRLARLEQGTTDEAAYAGWGTSAPLGGLLVLLLLVGGVLAWRRFDALSSVNPLTGLWPTGLLVIGGLLAAPAGEARAQTRALGVEDADGDSLVHVNDDGGFAVYGQGADLSVFPPTPGPGTIPVEGAGARMMWYPAKAAFRAGQTEFASWWEDDNIGMFSTAFGLSTQATADRSTAMGDETEASGAVSTAMGFQTNAEGSSSTAMGSQTTASGSQSTSMGDRTTASGRRSLAMGFHTTAATNNSLTVGECNDANRSPYSSTDALFVVGNGEYMGRDGCTRSDAFVVEPNGDVTVTGDLFIDGILTEDPGGTTSDRRLKEQIQPLGAGVLGKLEQVGPVRFQFKDERTHPSGPQLGLIAQEVQAQFPALVSEGASGYLSVSYSKFTAVLLKGLQEQQAQIQKQREQIERLRGQHTQIAALRAEVEALKKGRSQNAGWGPAAGGLLGLLLLGGGIVAVRRWRTPHGVSLLVLAGVGTLLLGTAPVSAQTVTIQNGATVSVENGSVFDLGTNSALVEDVSSGARLTSGTGVVTATRTLNAPSSTDVAGLGAVLSSSQNLGQTTVVRGHAAQTDNNNESIARYYDIQPGQNNSGLNATLQFVYDDAELNGLSESSLILFRSEDGGSTYTTAGYDSRNASANTVTLSGIGSFSRWTLGSESQPLPVELAGFEATQTDAGDVRLTWTTASETNNAGFEVQRQREAGANDGAEATSGGAGDWQTIGSVESKTEGGTTNAATTYRFTAGGLPSGTHAFRLRQIDLDGTEHVHDPVTVKVLMNEALRLDAPAPNPVYSQATLSFAVRAQAEVRVTLYNTLGQKVVTVYRGTPAAGETQTATLSVDDLASGAYFLRLQADGRSETERVTVVR